jgi:FlaA1/EpsC-like NDP-sugar epimerase
MRQSLSRLSMPVLALPRLVKRFIVLGVDLSLCVLTVWLAFYLRLGEFVSIAGSSEWAQGVMWASLASVSMALPIFVISGLYRAIFRYSGSLALRTVGQAVGIYAVLYAFVLSVAAVPGIPRTVGLIQPILLLCFVGASRLFARKWLGMQYHEILKRGVRPKVLIYGAGTAGRQLALAMTSSHEMQVVGFLDDDDRLHGRVLNGQPVYNPANLTDLVGRLKVSDVLLAIPSINRRRRNEILEQIRSVHVSVRTLPSVIDLAHGKVSISDLRALDIDDLLGREPVIPDPSLLAQNIRNKVVAVTGAGGSIGSELCRQILSIKPSKLMLIEQSEFALYAIHHELLEILQENQDAILLPLLGSVQDEARMREIMRTWCPDTVYHAAAYKHVPLVEHNPAEGIKNNVMGTVHAAQAAVENGVSDFVLISTDKAVRPTNIMGASKRMAEMVLQALAATNPTTKFSMVRFGNVLGSSGSVVPRFRQQIRDGGPITLTHTEITRYFMTISEASQLVIQAGAMANGGDVFVLDMGEPVKIIDLAYRMVELSGLTVKDQQNLDGDIAIEITGLRPGEKLYEELLIGDNPMTTQHVRIMKAHEEFLSWTILEQALVELMAAVDVNDVPRMRYLIQKLVPGYHPEGDVVDWVYLQELKKL